MYFIQKKIALKFTWNHSKVFLKILPILVRLKNIYSARMIISFIIIILILRSSLEKDIARGRIGKPAKRD